MKHRFIDFTKFAFCDIQKADNEFSGPFDHLKHGFLDLARVAFWHAQRAFKEFPGPGDTLKHCLFAG
jgi:hypothetical protein